MRITGWMGVAVAAALFGASTNGGAALLSFRPLPNSEIPEFPEIVWDGTRLRSGAGATGNGDGHLRESQQTPGGFMLETPLTINLPIAGKVVSITGSTTFHDVTLRLRDGWEANGPLISIQNIFVQPLGSGKFDLLATDGTLLLTAYAPSGVVTARSNSTGGSVLASGLSYFGGAIKDALCELNFPLFAQSISISMVSNTPFTTDPNNQLSPFHVDATGLTDSPAGGPTTDCPEPVALSWSAIAGLLLLRRSHRASIAVASRSGVGSGGVS